VPQERGAARKLGSGIGLAAGAGGQSAWLVGADSGEPGEQEVQEVDLRGAPETTWLALPPGWRLIRGVSDGLLLSSDTGWQVWDPSRRRTVRLQREARVVAAATDRLAWVSDDAEPATLHVTKLAGGDTTEIR